MKKQSEHRHPPLYKSFAYAFAGIFTCLKKERNIKIHLFMALMVTVFGFILKISVTEWCICLVLFGLIISLELVNTAVEAVVDLVTEEKHPLAGYAKDTAAGAVLAASIFAAAVGLIIFVPKLFALLLNLLS